MASTGSSRDAVNAGTIPAISPIMIASEVPRITFPKLRTNSKSATFDITMVMIQTKIRPTAPPNKHKMMASNKN